MSHSMCHLLPQGLEIRMDLANHKRYARKMRDANGNTIEPRKGWIPNMAVAVGATGAVVWQHVFCHLQCVPLTQQLVHRRRQRQVSESMPKRRIGSREAPEWLGGRSVSPDVCYGSQPFL